jgi:hypothetical protein
MAKLTKSKFLRSSNNIHISTLIDSGIDSYFNYKNNNILNLDFDDRLEMHKLVYVLNKLISGDILYKYYLNKDSTASVLQHLFKYIGIKDCKSLEICNIYSTEV